MVSGIMPYGSIRVGFPNEPENKHLLKRILAPLSKLLTLQRKLMTRSPLSKSLLAFPFLGLLFVMCIFMIACNETNLEKESSRSSAVPTKDVFGDATGSRRDERGSRRDDRSNTDDQNRSGDPSSAAAAAAGNVRREASSRMPIRSQEMKTIWSASRDAGRSPDVQSRGKAGPPDLAVDGFSVTNLRHFNDEFLGVIITLRNKGGTADVSHLNKIVDGTSLGFTHMVEVSAPGWDGDPMIFSWPANMFYDSTLYEAQGMTTIPITVPYGNHELTVTLDPTDTLSEANEQNNIETLLITPN